MANNGKEVLGDRDHRQALRQLLEEALAVNVPIQLLVKLIVGGTRSSLACPERTSGLVEGAPACRRSAPDGHTADAAVDSSAPET